MAGGGPPGAGDWEMEDGPGAFLSPDGETPGLATHWSQGMTPSLTRSGLQAEPKPGIPLHVWPPALPPHLAGLWQAKAELQLRNGRALGFRAAPG